MFDRWRQKELFVTHTPEFYPVGMIKDGYRITEIRRTTNTALLNGGSAPCFKVLGVPQ